MTDAEKL
jgi:ATP-dependent RNA helicase DDX42